MVENAKTCVIVCYWVGRAPNSLYRLLNQMVKVDAGAPFDVLIVCNGGDDQPLTLPKRFSNLRPKVLNRENTGYNIGAWEHGWRTAHNYEYFLFLQDECVLKKPGWVSEFEYRFSREEGIGLLGESIMWDRMSWRFIREATDRDLGSLAWPKDEPIHPLDTYQSFLDQRGIPRGETGTHLQTLVLFTSLRILREINGFLTGVTYREAVACEIAISRLIEAKGYRISKVKDQPFELIGHSQWTKGYEIKMKIRQKVVNVLTQLGLKRAATVS